MIEYNYSNSNIQISMYDILVYNVLKTYKDKLNN